jgi:predicted RNA methylase
MLRDVGAGCSYLALASLLLSATCAVYDVGRKPILQNEVELMKQWLSRFNHSHALFVQRVEEKGAGAK